MTVLENPNLAAVPTGAAAVALDNVSKAFGNAHDAVVALDRVSLEVRRGEVLCLVGASGGGKWTLLNLAAGLAQPPVGAVGVGGKPELMFQDAALFPWLSVADNVALP